MLFGAAQCRAHARQEQDVAEAARQARARKEQEKKAPHVYTDDDLKRAKILTPEDKERLAAARKQTPPVLSETPASLDASLDLSQLSLGDVARRYRIAKQAVQGPDVFHLPVDEPVFAEPVFAAPVAELPAVAAPLPEFVVPHPKVLKAQPKTAVAPAVSGPAPVHRVDPFAPRLGPAAPKPALHLTPTSPHVPAAANQVAPSAPRMQTSAPAADALHLPGTDPAAPKPTVHVAPAIPHLPAANPAPAAAPRLPFTVPGAQLILPNIEPAAPKLRPPLSPAVPHAPVAPHGLAPAVPRIDHAISNPAEQLTLPSLVPAAPKPELHLAPVAPHVPAARQTTLPVAPRLDGAFSGMAGALGHANPKVAAGEVVKRGVVAAAPVMNTAAAHQITVQRGDSLWNIARKTLGHGSRWQELLAANPSIVDPEQLTVGSIVVVPSELLSRKSQQKSVVVWRGDSLTKIARANYGHASAWKCVAAANPEIKNPNRIYEGQNLSLPESCKP